MDLPAHLRPFVLPTPEAARERRGRTDLYLPDADGPRPAVVFVHGGPVPAERLPTPRDWPVYSGYGALAAARGLVGVTVDHRLHGLADYPVAAADVVDAIGFAREDPRVDPDRVALWFFSGGGLLLADWLRDRPAWLRCLAASYPLLGVPPGAEVAAGYRPAEAVRSAGRLPIVLTRVGRERPPIAATVDDFLTAAAGHAAGLRVIDVPNGQHGFDCLDHTEESRTAVTAALEAVHGALTI